MSDRISPTEDARRERDEAQARADAAEKRLNAFTQRLTYVAVLTLIVLALAGAGIVLAPDQVVPMLLGTP